jgi:pyruvate/2-oxoglutarate dehydrogenase complex dihydrolipoamide acyltransferase (E2) component
MKNEILNEGQLALEKALLMMKYDSKDTLSENLEKINLSEQVQSLLGAAERGLSNAAATEIKTVLQNLRKPLQTIDGVVLSNGDDVVKALKAGKLADDGIRSIRTALLKSTTNPKIRTKLIDSLLENPQVLSKYAGKTENQIKAAFKKLGYSDEAALETATKIVNKSAGGVGAGAGAAANTTVNASKLASLYSSVKGLKWKGLPRIVRWGLTGAGLYAAYRYFIHEEELFPQCLEKKIPDNLLSDTLKNKSVIIKSTGNRQIDTLGGLKFYLDSNKVSSVNGSYTGTYSCDGDNLMSDIGGSEFIVTGSVVGSGLASAAAPATTSAAAPATTSAAAPATKVAPITDTKLLNTLKFDYEFPGDKGYTYAFVPTVTEDTSTQSGTWYAKSNKTGKVFDITKNYPQTAEKLNTQFPNAATTGSQTTQTDEKPNEPKLPAQPPAPNPNSAAGSEPPTVQSESLKKSLKKNLIEAKEKQEDLMVENKIITNRFNFLFEGRSFETEKEKDYLVESIITEIGYLKTQGYSSRAINEGLFSMLGNIFGGSVKSIPAVFGEYIAGWLTKTLGIPQNSYMGSVVVALVGNLNIADYDKFFSDCRFASNKIADSLIEGYVLQLQNEKNLNTGASGFIVSALRNSVVDYFTEDKSSLIQILEDKIGEFLCPKLSKLSSAISDKTDDLKSKIVA